jgi:hypothetical protein
MKCSSLTIGLAIGTALVGATAARAQASADTAHTAQFSGVVVRQADAAPVTGADVWMITLDRHALADRTGTFAFTGLAPGAYLVEIRAIGFVARRDTVTLAAGQSLRRRYALTVQAVTLDTVHTIADQQRYLTAALRGFEERRLSGNGGHFISDSVLRHNENSTLANIIRSRIPGVTFSGPYLVSSRKQCKGAVFAGPCKAMNCYVAVYIDGVLDFRSQMTDEVTNTAQLRTIIPDLTRINVSDYAGVEFYADAASAPIGMHSDDDGCGSLYLWTREK